MVESQTIDETLDTLDRILNNVRSQGLRRASAGNDDTNVNSQTIDRTLDKLNTILGIVDDETVPPPVVHSKSESPVKGKDVTRINPNDVIPVNVIDAISGDLLNDTSETTSNDGKCA